MSEDILFLLLSDMTVILFLCSNILRFLLYLVTDLISKTVVMKDELCDS